MNWYSLKENNIELNIYVVPRSSKTEVVGLYNDSLKIKLKSPPVDNEANEELIKFLANELKLSKKNIQIVKGHNQKRKIVLIIGVELVKLKQVFS